MADRVMVFGVDPGAHGGIARLDVVDGVVQAVDVWDIPTRRVLRGKRNRSEILPGETAKLFETHVPAVAVIEQTSPRPTDALIVVETLTASRWCFAGIWGAMGIDCLVVSPRAWQSRILTIGRPAVTTGERNGRAKRRKQIKAAAVEAVRYEYGDGVALVPDGCRVPADGRADAVCVATYGGRQLGLIGV